MTRLLKLIMQALGRKTQMRLKVTFADGSSIQNREGEPLVRLHYKTIGAQWKTILFGHVGLFESYFDQTLEIDGDFGRAMAIGFESGFDRAQSPIVWLRNHWHELRFGNRTIARAKENARFHYALGADFYGYWLDRPLMMYTCGYWKPGTRTVEEAQRNKIDHVCRKLHIESSDSVVDIGCGFGGFMIHANQHYGPRVCGTNTTTEQVVWLQDQIRARGLSDQLEVRESDFREAHAQFDKVVSIGVLEHAGRDQLDSVVKAHADFLKPGGLGMLHFIGHVG
ncbi:MAG: class I SAM-dependent methyltransferase, partial [Betaproteobacteria bacterium]